MHLWVWNCLIQRIKLKQLSKNKPLKHATIVVINIEIHVNKCNLENCLIQRIMLIQQSYNNFL